MFLCKIEENLKSSFEEKVQQLTGKEEKFVRTKSELEDKISQQERALGLINETLKQRDLEVSRIKKEKDEQLKEEEKHLSVQIMRLTKQLEEERAYQTEVLKDNLKLKQELQELQEKQKTVKLNEVISARNEFELKNKILATNEELMNIKGEYSAEKEAFTKNIFNKQQEISGLHDVVNNYRIDLEKQSEEQQKELNILKSESAQEIQRLKKKSEEQTLKAAEMQENIKYTNRLVEELKLKEKQSQEHMQEFEAFKARSA